MNREGDVFLPNHQQSFRKLFGRLKVHTILPIDVGIPHFETLCSQEELFSDAV